MTKSLIWVAIAAISLAPLCALAQDAATKPTLSPTAGAARQGEEGGATESGSVVSVHGCHVRVPPRECLRTPSVRGWVSTRGRVASRRTIQGDRRPSGLVSSKGICAGEIRAALEERHVLYRG